MVRRLVAGSLGFLFAFLIAGPGSDGRPGLAAVPTQNIAAPRASNASLPGAAALVIQGMMLVLRAAP